MTVIIEAKRTRKRSRQIVDLINDCSDRRVPVLYIPEAVAYERNTISHTIEDFYTPRIPEILSTAEAADLRLAMLLGMIGENRSISLDQTQLAYVTPEVVEALRKRAYTVIIDEAVNSLMSLNELVREEGWMFTESDVRHMIANCLIGPCGAGHQMEWRDRPGIAWPEKYREAERYAKCGNLFLRDMELWVFGVSPLLVSGELDVRIFAEEFAGSQLGQYCLERGDQFVFWPGLV